MRGLARGAIVVVLSDGWDRGDPDVLAEQMAAPVAGRPPHRVGEPAQGHARLRARWRAAWPPRCPYVDDFVEGHSLAALQELAEEIVAGERAHRSVREILDDIERWRAAGRRVAVARVVDIEGSGPA